MYQDHFGLYTAPFALSPHLQFVYHSTTFEETMAHLIYGIEGGEEIMLITGEIGTGKTLALKNLTEHISSTYQVALINVTQIDFKDLLKLFLAELGVTPAPEADRADLLIALQNYMAGLAKEGRRCLLVVDEAQNMDVEILEGVRLLTNLGPSDRQALQIVLSGQPSLRSRIDQPELLQLRQRIRVHYHLTILDEKETRAYIDHRLKVAGASGRIFRPDAVAKLHAMCGGIPRLVNIVADRALLSAYVDGSKEVLPKHIEDDDGLVRSPEAETVSAQRAAQAAEVLPPAPLDEPMVGDDKEFYDRPRRVSPWLIGIASLAVLVAILAVVWGLGRSDQAELPVANEPAAATTSGVDAEPADVQEPVAEPETSPVDSTAVAAPDTTAAQADPTPEAAVAVVEPEPEPAAADDEAEALAGVPVETGPAPSMPDAVTTPHYVPDYTGLSVHVGSFLEYERAEAQAVQIAALGLDVAFKPVQLEGVTWYRVYSGPYDDIDAVRAGQVLIQSRNVSSWTMIVRVR